MATTLMRGIDWGTRLPDRKVTYAFVDQGISIDSPFGKIVSAGFVGYEKQQFRKAFELYASFTKLRFKEVAELEDADFRLLTFRTDSTLLGAMGPPGFARSAGVGAFNYAGLGWDYQLPGEGGLEQGGFGFITIIHEVGHGLGLAHPHDDGGRSTVFPGVSFFGDLGDYNLNQGIYTTMSYNDGWKTNPAGLPPGYEYGYQGTPMAIDIAVLQKKYGANDTYHRGDNVYLLPVVNDVGTFYSCIWDAGGRDAIINPGGGASTIDLRAATLRPEPGGGGYLSYVDGIFGGYTVARKVAIENAAGGSGDDVITGNDVKNRLNGGDGDDLLFGGERKDKLFGGPGSDRIDAGTGRDRLYGGGGEDVLIGGAGGDSFVFDVPAIPDNTATILDFLPGLDIIQLAVAAFPGIGPAGVLAAAAFAVGDAATDPATRIVYEVATGLLRYDQDGSGPSLPAQIANLAAGLALSHADILVVG
ncbi:MAG TPA: M10 family metallopeptidase [Bauldia sp.]|nr:M10 family metallopeptidase [Bauldia sp.]